MNCCLATHCVFSSINLLFLLITIISPCWVVHYHGTGDIHTGLWFSCSEKRCSYVATTTASLSFARATLIIALGSCLVAWMSSMRILTQFVNLKINENLISSVANFITGFCVLSTLVMMYFRLRLLSDKGLAGLAPNWAFFLSGIVCSLSFMLGVLSLVWCQLLDAAQTKLCTRMDLVQVKEPTLVDYLEAPI